MTYVLRFRPEVVQDLENAAKWYDERRTGLGGDFLKSKQEGITADLSSLGLRINPGTEEWTIFAIGLIPGRQEDPPKSAGTHERSAHHAENRTFMRSG